MKTLYRSTKNVKIAGVCGGIAEMFKIDPTVVRFAVLFLALVTGIFPVVVTYVVAWMIMPQGTVDEHK